MKSAEEIMDMSGSIRSDRVVAGRRRSWPGCSHHTVAQYVAARERGALTPGRAQRRAKLIDEFLPKIEEWVERSKGKIRADVAHEKLVALGYAGSERTTRRAVAEVKATYRPGRRAGAPAVGDRAGDVAAVRLRRRPGHRRGQDAVVLRVAGVVAVPGGAGDAGQDAADGDGRPGS